MLSGFYDKGEYDLSGFSVGVVDKKAIINGAGIKNGDVLIGLSSSGIHSNGYSLVRKLFFDIEKYSPRKKIRELGCTLGEELLKPTKIYVKSVLKTLRRFKVKGIAHITGGGLTENLPRVLSPKSKLKFAIEKGSWPIQNIFSLIQSKGSISDSEMYKTFNMGIGMVLVVNSSDAQKIIKKLNRLGEEAFIIGRAEKGKGGVEYV
jgi:phosphoribosylformylglycinamidine cyclo-ligase